MELTNEETICVAQHLIAQHRQTVFDRTSSVAEACMGCPIKSKCFNKDSEENAIWGNTYKKVCKAVGIKCSFRINEYPLVPYEREDIR